MWLISYYINILIGVSFLNSYLIVASLPPFIKSSFDLDIEHFGENGDRIYRPSSLERTFVSRDNINDSNGTINITDDGYGNYSISSGSGGIHLTLECHPYVNNNYSKIISTYIYNNTKIDFSNVDDICDLFGRSFELSMKELVKRILLLVPINVNIVLYPFCTSNPCTNTVLGFASPTTFYEFSDSDLFNTTKNGVDENYLYPSALAKQYMPLIPSNSTDITAHFNIAAKWLLPHPELGNPSSKLFNSNNNWVGGLMYAESDGKTVKLNRTENLKVLPKVYDIQQTMIHEVIHGLGFLSSYRVVNGKYIVPGIMLQDKDGKSSLGKSYIYDKFLADVGSGIWLKDIGQNLTDSINAVPKGEYSISTLLSLTQSGLQYARQLFYICTSPGRLAIFYPVRPRLKPMKNVDAESLLEKKPIEMDHAVVFTSSNWMQGSSLSHLDDRTYRGTSDSLMRPYGIPYVSLKNSIPISDKGPLGRKVLGILRAMGYVVDLEPF